MHGYIQPAKADISKTYSFRSADTLLNWSTRFWFGAAAIGQWIFTWYIIVTYWAPTAAGQPTRWDALPADFSFAFIAHVGLALGVFVSGPLQLIPQIRTYFPSFHRWNGRAYLFCVAIASIAGLYMIWFHSDVGGIGVQLGTSISALLCAYFGWQAVRFAIAGHYALHRRFALRLFISAAAVWFFRIQLMLWLMLSGGRGIDPETFHGPALVVVSFTQYVIPLLILEFYFAVQNSPAGRPKVIFAGVLTAMTLFMMLGLYAASVGMWFPARPTPA